MQSLLMLKNCPCNAEVNKSFHAVSGDQQFQICSTFVLWWWNFLYFIVLIRNTQITIMRARHENIWVFVLSCVRFLFPVFLLYTIS